MTQPNFLSVTRSLDAALSFCSKNPTLRSSTAYNARLTHTQRHFAAMTTETDAAYTRWRQAVGTELTALRQLRLEIARVMELLDEHGYDEAPARRIIYTERADMLRATDELVQFLTRHQSEWEWIPGRIAALRGLVASAEERRRSAEGLLATYQVQVKARVSAYGQALADVREYLHDVRGDVRDSAALRELELVTL